MENKIQKICEEYDIGNFVSIEKVPVGVLNDNYILHTDTGKYFIKSVREKARNRLSMIYGVESFMKSGKIPAVTMIKTKFGKIFATDGDKIYTLYPYIEAENGDNFPGKNYGIVGEMLGKIHIAGSKDTSNISDLKEFKRPSDEIIIDRLKKYRNEIASKSNMDETDKLFLEYIDFKLFIAKKIKPHDLPNDTLIHGDYHPGNLLMSNESGKIVGICDWEKAEFGPRSYELARSLLYCCFSDGYKINQAMVDSKLFLKGYLSVFPMEVDEVVGGLNMRIHRTALSSWIEEKYYEDRDNRANKFIRHEMNLMDTLVNKQLFKEIIELL